MNVRNVNVAEENAQGGHLDSLNLVEKQLRILRFIGIVPPDGNTWSYKIYTIAYALVLINYIAVFYIVGAAFPQYVGNISMMTEIIFQLAICVDASILGTYFTVNRNTFIKLFKMIDTHFTKFINKTVSPTNRAIIITRITKESKMLSDVLLANIAIVMIIWTVLAFIVKTIDEANGKLVDENDVQVHSYFCAVTWIPEGILQSPAYEIFYIYQVISVLVAVSHFTACNVVFFFFLYYIASHFELLLSCIQEIDTKFPEDSIYDLDEIEISNLFLLNEEQPLGINKTVVEDVNSNEVSHTRIDDDKSEFDEDFITGLSTTEKARLNHLIECIKYHQELLE